ncbi:MULTISPECIES: ABC transporter ATP-binding protein [Aequorivita]|jgi:Cu-processing system ATP-binding protein|uniref:Copper ABC transporter ATP-binding protein n=2 Tax=Aequorivita TaxID=153265 RepID=A0A137RM25_9FLAO|nr:MULTISPECIES: ABC transporter ATP-binding protein [Aequorivita]MAB56697.1 ABC transporter ATP-binding protein [Aequorivita sp.]KJJ39014.1 copper ABC transporter ATP-binding protein [Aequorivita vladivostokensis]KXO01184.1 copper ABC transporter ATP-binding protein [Aequorivita aquimaris]MBF30834.1 ABC transporter ATP-binding protein [Aequorivita sp.]MDX1782611.1 ABC transporter ATP-binding protein [Aequorivita vladivostokensis]|tara:strand:- start:49433 stop:50143 length:711 start_codon:yes stop_codon:yes gene_type:complete
MIEVKDLHKKFGKNEVLKGIDLNIERGGIFSVLGPNGSGKTTLIKCILGMVLPDSGAISVDGKPLKNNFKYRNEIDYLPQIANFPGNLKVNELIAMIKDLRDSKATKDEELIELFKLQPFLNKKLANLSGGTKQKVNLVLTFMFDSPLIILDEPTSGLDPISHLRLKNLIFSEREKGKTILVTSHILSFVEEIADEIVFLLEGKIYFKGTITELKTKTEQPDFEHAIASILSSSYA